MPAPTYRPDGRTYWQTVCAACGRRDELHPESPVSPDAAHWALLVLASRDDHLRLALPVGVAPRECVSMGEALFATNRNWCVWQLAAMTGRKWTPRPVTSLMTHEQTPSLATIDCQLASFLLRECEMQGRGTAAEAAKFLIQRGIDEGIPLAGVWMTAAPTCMVRLARMWAKPDGQDWIVAAMRPYLDRNPSVLEPISN